MSKMPAKKKSCFQITSVTPAQVAASSITDDTESLDDPDESRTEDVSSEIFDVSRGADLLGVCDRSSSEETLNNVGEPQEGQPAPATGPVNGGFSVKSVGTGHVSQHVLGGGGVPLPTASQPSIPNSATQQPTIINTVTPATGSASVTQAAPVVTSATSTTTCSSRFRVIKLDHGTGEPFRRGRWTCTEFYERDSEGSSMSRTVDSIKHAMTLDHSLDRDSGLGATVGSVVVPNAVSAQAQESTADSGYSVAHHTHPPELQQQGYGLAPQLGSGASAFQPAGYSVLAPQHPQQAQVNMQPIAPQTLLPSGLNGAPQGTMLQKSPIMPPAMQAQQFAYSTHPVGILAGQQDYRQQHFAPLQPQGSSTQTLPMASLFVGPPASQGPSPVITPAGPGAHGLGMVAQGGQAAAVQALLLHLGGGTAMAPVLPGGGLQQLISQPQPSSGVGGGVSAPSTTHSGIQNVPATVPIATNMPPGMLSQVGGLAQAQGARGGATGNQTEDSRRKSDALPQPSTFPFPGRDGMKPFNHESLNLPTPTVTSLFGITIPIDGDEDRNPSTAFYQAFQSSRSRGSKPASDSASGASVVAIDNKIEQAMDLVKSHLMYAVREEVEVLKEQIKELYERNSLLERENAVLKSLANSEQLSQLSGQVSPAGSTSPPQQQQQQHPIIINNNNNNNTNTPAAHHEGGQSNPHQPNVTSA